MSIQWTFIAGYLYFEIAIVAILMLPIASPRRWQQFFRSRLFAMFREHAAVYFYVLLGVLSLFLLDSVREMRKYSHADSHGHLSTEMKGNVKLFRSQRNFYITGFAIFLAFVIRRLVTMILIQAELLEKSERIIREAETAKDFAKTTVLTQALQSAGDSNNLENLERLLLDEQNRVKELEEEVTSLKEQLNEAKCKLAEKKSEIE
ncbi:B-cell receptor-associated protein 31-like [Leguminivora glycinivorella]|uniref:B-cell receptor-associated protein 31-like n=1 Tax=Leguminivora glycinivorella TaxID=1035111 RepID=UPI00200BFB60|nr:B-cell receptor-associated protein 31-like [Leguminivora glycinivorella]